MVDKEFLTKEYKDMTKEELLLAREFEASMLERVTNALMLPDADDDALDFARPLLDDCKKCIKEIDELLAQTGKK
jgi:hypothetical protein